MKIANGFERSAHFIAYPFGTYNDIVNYNDRVIVNVKQIYTLGRSTVHETTQQHIVASDIAIQYLMRVIPIHNDTTIPELKAIIEEVIKSKLLAIMMFHDVVDSNPTNDLYTYLVRDLKILSDWLKSRSSDIDVVTYSDYMMIT